MSQVGVLPTHTLLPLTWSFLTASEGSSLLGKGAKEWAADREAHNNSNETPQLGETP